MPKHFSLLIPCSHIAVLTLAVAAFGAEVAKHDFDGNFEIATAAAGTDEGATYDAALAGYFFSRPDITSALTRCVNSTTDSLDVLGYFDFDAAGGYRLVVQPENSFSKCLVAVFDNKSPPSPPRRPYLHPFSFGLDSDAPAQAARLLPLPR